MSLLVQKLLPKATENLPQGAMSLATPEGRDLGPLLSHFFPLSLQLSSPQQGRELGVSHLTLLTALCSPLPRQSQPTVVPCHVPQ